MALIKFRKVVKRRDIVAIKRIISSTRFFNDEELGIAIELITERLQKGKSSGYHFLFAEIDDNVVGYACYGTILGTEKSYDLYWIAVDNAFRGKGIGKQLIFRTEKIIKDHGGGRIYAETSSKEAYLSTRQFYLSCGYCLEAQLKDFYGTNDGKCIFVKVV